MGFQGTVGRAAFAEAVAVVAAGVSGRSTQPVQNNIFLRSEADYIRLVATDLEFLQVSVTLPASGTGDEAGAVTLPARVLSGLARQLAGDEVALSGTVGGADNPRASLYTEGAVGGLEAGPSAVNLRGMSADDFETLPNIADGDPVTVTLAGADLRDLIRGVLPAVSSDETRPTLTGVSVEVDKGASLVRLVATDTHRLALREAPCVLHFGASGEVPEAILFGAYLAAVAGLLEGMGEEVPEVELRLSAKQAEVRGLRLAGGVGEVVLSSRVIEGQFPDYHQIIPESSERQVTVNRKALAEALGRLAVVASEDAERVTFTHDGTGELHLFADSPDVGDMTEVLAAELAGEPWEASFNRAYIADGLRCVGGDQVIIEANGALNPMQVLSGPGATVEARYVLMPMQK